MGLKSRAAEGKPRVSIAALQRDRPRRCTDILFLVLFLLALATAGYSSVYGAERGQLDRVIYGQDYMADLCGQDNSIQATGNAEVVQMRTDDASFIEMLFPFARLQTQRQGPVRRGMRDHTHRRLLYYTLPAGGLGGFESVPVCLEACPRGNTTPGVAPIDNPGAWVCTGKYTDGPPASCPGGRGDAPECIQYRASYFLLAGLDRVANCSNRMSDCDVCYPPYPATQVLNMCIPDQSKTFSAFGKLILSVAEFGATVGAAGNPDYAHSAYDGVEGGGGGTEEVVTPASIDGIREAISNLPHLVFEDMSIAWPVVTGCSSGAVFACLIWLLLIRLLSGVMVWLTLVGLAVGAAIGCWYLHALQARMKGDARYGDDEQFSSVADGTYVGFWVATVSTSIYVLLIVCLRRQIQLAARALSAAALALAELPTMLVLPIVTSCLAMVSAAGGCLLCLLLVSCGEVAYGRPGFGHLFLDTHTKVLLLVTILTTFWATVFVRHVQHAAVGGAVSKWYAHRRDDGSGADCCGGGSRVLMALGHVLRYHAGSVALGSLFIASLKVVRFCFFLLRSTFRKHISHRLQAAGCGSSNAFARLCCCCIACCLSCMERTLEALSRYAYAQMMVSKRPFCASAHEAVRLLTTNLASAATIRFVAALFLLLGKLVVAACCTGIGILYMHQNEPYKSQLYHVAHPATAIAIASFGVALVFFGVYNMTIDTIFLNLCADRERVSAGMPLIGRAHELSGVLGVELAEEFDVTPRPSLRGARRPPPQSKRMLDTDDRFSELSSQSSYGNNPFNTMDSMDMRV